MRDQPNINIEPLVMTGTFTARIMSSKGEDKFYDVDVTGPDFCTCPGFEYRGNCRHIKELRTKLGIDGV